MPTEPSEDLSVVIMSVSRRIAKLTPAQRIHVLKTVASVLGVELVERAKA